MPPVPTVACKNMHVHVHVIDRFLYAVSAIEFIRQEGGLNRLKGFLL
jgi:hypothetical protein